MTDSMLTTFKAKYLNFDQFLGAVIYERGFEEELIRQIQTHVVILMFW